MVRILTDPNKIEVGDFIQIGGSSLTWTVVDIWPANDFYEERADMRSGQSNNYRYAVPLRRCVLHSKGAVPELVLELVPELEESDIPQEVIDSPVTKKAA